MAAVRNAGSTTIRLAGVLLLMVALVAGLMAPERASAATFSPGDPVVTTDTVNVRTKAGTSGPIRAVAQAGEAFTIGQINPIRANGYTWYRVSTATRVNYGWIASDFLAYDEPFDEGDCAVVVDGSLNLRSRAGTSASVVTVLADGTGVEILGNDPVKASGYLWYRVSAAGSTGWAASQFLQLDSCGSTGDPVITVPTTVRVVDGPLNVREEPDTSADIVRVLSTGEGGVVDDGPVVADGYTWLGFRNSRGEDGWIAADFVVEDLTQTGEGIDLAQGDSFVVTTDALNVREQPGLDGEIIDVAAFGAVGKRVVGTLQVVDGLDWIRVSIPNVGTGWVVLDYVEEL